MSFEYSELVLVPRPGHLVLHPSIRLFVAWTQSSPILVADHAAKGFCEWGFSIFVLRIVMFENRRVDVE